MSTVLLVLIGAFLAFVVLPYMPWYGWLLLVVAAFVRVFVSEYQPYREESK